MRVRPLPGPCSSSPRKRCAAGVSSGAPAAAPGPEAAGPSDVASAALDPPQTAVGTSAHTPTQCQTSGEPPPPPFRPASMCGAYSFLSGTGS